MEQARPAALLVVIAVAGSWVASTQLAQLALIRIHVPAFMVWFTVCFNVLVFPAVRLARAAARACCGCDSTAAATGQRQRLPEHHTAAAAVAGPSNGALLRLAAGLYPLYFGANYLYTRALMSMSAALVTATFAATPAFVLCLSVAVLGERFTGPKGCAVAATFAGVFCMSFESGDGGNNPPLGVALTLGACLCAAAYKVLFKQSMLRWPTTTLMMEDDGGDAGDTVGRYLSLVGVVNVLPGLALVLVLSWTGAEPIEWGSVPMGLVAVHAVSALAFNFFVNYGVSLTTPLWVSVGTVLGIPLNYAVDMLRGRKLLGWRQSAGAALVVAAFLVLARGRGGEGSREEHGALAYTTVVAEDKEDEPGSGGGRGIDRGGYNT